MHIGITGGTGLVGQAVAHHFKQLGHTVHIFTREKNPDLPFSQITWLQGTVPTELPPIDYYVHLAGASINDGRWTEKRKSIIYNSRMEATDALIEMIQQNKIKPKAVFQASATGIYPFSETKRYDESSEVSTDHFLARTVRDWEKRAEPLQQLGVRTVFMRFGIVLARDGGALPLMALPYRLFGGGKVGTGKQWVSWIHIDDIVHAILFFIKHETIEGPVNLTAPHPVRMDHFGKAIGQALHRPHWFPVPSTALKIALGEKSDLALKGQYVDPKKLRDAHYPFLYPHVEDALQNLLSPQ